MPALPTTTPAHYLTGTSAMAIPSEDTTFVDWHFVDGFLNGRASFRIAGVNFPDTAAVLDDFGVRECGGILRRSGVDLPGDQPFYAANRDRALLDLILANVARHHRPDHLRLEDYFDCLSEQERFEGLLDRLDAKLMDASQLALLRDWRAAQ